MRIWFISPYNSPPNMGHLNRHFYFAKYLKELGHEPIIFVNSKVHNTAINNIRNGSFYLKDDSNGFDTYFIKICDYNNSKIKRIFTFFQYYFRTKKLSKKLKKPDVIIGSSPHPLAPILANKLGKKFNCQSIVEIRDLWPESFVAYNIMKKNNLFLKLFYLGEKWIYKNADKIIFLMEGGRDYIINQKWDKKIDLNKIYHLNNGVDLEKFNFNLINNVFLDKILDDDSKFKICYAGSIRKVNKIHLLLEVADQLKEYKDIVFLIYGNGDCLLKLIERTGELGLNNVEFKGFVEKDKIPYILSKSNLNIIIGENNELGKYGISANKIFEYLASGKPILQTFRTDYSIVKNNKCGLETSDFSVKEVIDSILYFYNMDNLEYNVYCDNAINTSKKYDFKSLSRKLIEIIEDH
ncbi:MAG: glycosyltransferase family 4 protein [Acholeplasma sp.]|nr:glycosyltransferase family 4 protein [Acholeplasma sp.]